ncbi:16793_t:CDS:2, partial [Racocetra persica]
NEKMCIRMLSKDKEIKNICSNFVTRRNKVQKIKKFVFSSTEIAIYDQWIEKVHKREHIAKIITDVLLQEIRFNALRKIFRGSENSFIEIISYLIDTTMYHLPVECNIDVTKTKQRWEKLVYFESDKWNASDKKTPDDHNKLAHLCLDGYDEISKKYKKNILYKNYIEFGVNVAAKAKIPFNMESVKEIEEFVHALLILRNGVIVNLHCLVNSFQTRSRKVSERSSSRDAGRLNKKKNGELKK